MCFTCIHVYAFIPMCNQMTKSFSPYYVSCIQENPNLQQEYICTFMAFCKQNCFSVFPFAKIIKMSFGSICFSYYNFLPFFSMGHNGSNHPKKAKPEMSERAQHLGQSHWGQQLNMWFEDDMEQAIREYHQLVFWCSTLEFLFQCRVNVVLDLDLDYCFAKVNFVHNCIVSLLLF